jgi:hypothetical protein
LLRRSPIVPLDWETNVQTTMPPGLFTNDTRWNGFRWWCDALGFGQSALSAFSKKADQKSTRAKVVPNPAVAVIDAIQNPFGEALPVGEPIPITQFLSHLRSELPVLPGHATATYEGLAEERDEGLRALGLALASAEARRVLTMGYQSDPTGVMALPDAQDFQRPRYVSTVKIGGLAG